MRNSSKDKSGYEGAKDHLDSLTVPMWFGEDADGREIAQKVYATLLESRPLLIRVTIENEAYGPIDMVVLPWNTPMDIYDGYMRKLIHSASEIFSEFKDFFGL